MFKNKTKPNWLLRGLIGISIGIHLVIFMHIAGIYRSSVLTCIELTLKDISKPPSRSIPRPRYRPKKVARPPDVKMPRLNKNVIPMLKPLKIDPFDNNLPDSLAERISIPDVPGASGLNISEWQPGAQIKTSDFITLDDYFEMVRLRIERYKKYPNAARIRQIEGRTTVRFVIESTGSITALAVLKSSGTNILDQAALNAMKRASPFPKPPAHLFKGPIPLELAIVFELT